MIRLARSARSAIVLATLFAAVAARAQTRSARAVAGAPSVLASLSESFVTHVGVAAEKEAAVFEGVDLDDVKWRYEFDTGMLDVGGRSLHAQLLGSYIDADKTWVWAWADPKADGFAESTLVAARRLRRTGDADKIEWLRTPRFAMPSQKVAVLAAAAAALVDAKAHFFAQKDGICFAWAIDDPSLPALPPANTLQVIDLFSTLVMVLELPNHRLALESYLRARGYVVATAGLTLKATHPTADGLVASFDKLGRFKKASAILTPAKTGAN